LPALVAITTYLKESLSPDSHTTVRPIARFKPIPEDGYRNGIKTTVIDRLTGVSQHISLKKTPNQPLYTVAIQNAVCINEEKDFAPCFSCPFISRGGKVEIRAVKNPGTELLANILCSQIALGRGAVYYNNLDGEIGLVLN